MSVSKPPRQPVTFGGWLGSMWLYTLLRVALFLVLWGIFWLLGLGGILGGLIAAALSVPLSYVLLARPRQRFAAKIEQTIDERREQRAKLDEQLDPGNADDR